MRIISIISNIFKSKTNILIVKKDIVSNKEEHNPAISNKPVSDIRNRLMCPRLPNGEFNLDDVKFIQASVDIETGFITGFTYGCTETPKEVILGGNIKFDLDDLTTSNIIRELNIYLS